MNTVEWFDSISQANNMAQLNFSLQRCFGGLGVTHFAFTYYHHYAASVNKLKYSNASKPYKTWNQYYHGDECVDVDSTMRKVYQSNLPVYWDLQQQLCDAGSERERQMRLDSIEYGAEKGLCIPIHGPENDFATMVVVQMKGQSFMDEWQTAQYHIMNISQHYYERLKVLLIGDDSNKCDLQLSMQQRHCLALTAKQYSVKAIAEELGIKQRTVNYHIQKANKILGARNKHESVAKAKSHGLI